MIATDADPAGHVAAERHYWQLTPHGIDPRRANLPDGTDPADLLAAHGPTQLAATLDAAGPMAHTMITDRITHLPHGQAIDHATHIVAARPPHAWDPDSQLIADLLDQPVATIREALARHTRTWNHDPRQAAAQILSVSTEVHRRPDAAHPTPTPHPVDEPVQPPAAPTRTRDRTTTTITPTRPPTPAPPRR